MPKAEKERYVSIHVPIGMHRDLRKLAKIDGRSLQKEVLFLLALGMAITEQQRMGRDLFVTKEALA